MTRSKAKRRRRCHYERRTRRLRKKKALHTLNVRADPIVRLRCKISRLAFTTCRRDSNVRSYPYDSALFFYSASCITAVNVCPFAASNINSALMTKLHQIGFRLCDCLVRVTLDYTTNKDRNIIIKPATPFVRYVQ